MKFFTFLAILAFTITSAFSQSIEFVHKEEFKNAEPDESVVTSHATFKNTTAFDVGIKILLTVVEKTEGFDITFCDYWNCYYLFPDDTTFETDNAEIVASGAVGGDRFHLDISPNGLTGKAVINVKFFNENNEDDYIEYTATFSIGLGVMEDYYKGLLSFDDPAPNPAYDYTNIGYKLPLNSGDSYLEVFDASGRLVISELLEKGSSVMPLNVSMLPNGSYIYSIKAAGVRLPARKLIISR